MSKEQKKDFMFISEHIKNKPFYKKKWFTRTGAAVGLAIVFGAAAGLVFAVVAPWAQDTFGEPKKPTQIVIASTETKKPDNATDPPVESETLTQKPTQAPTEEISEAESQKPIEEKEELDLDAYRRLYSQMREVANKASNSIVTVIGSSSQIDWFNEQSENHVQASGLIVADNGTYMFILTEIEAIQNAERIRVSFSDETVVDAEFQIQDYITGLAIVRVPSDKIKEETRMRIDTTALGSACSVTMGTPVIALGSPLGYGDSMAFGMVTSIQSVSLEDREYNQIQTDIFASGEGSGIIVNLDGKIVGFITRDTLGSNLETTLSAVTAPEIVQLVEDMTNNKALAYMGVVGKEVTENIMKESNIPSGLYIKEVSQDSPAMYAGLQTGDVIISVGDSMISNMKEYMNKMKEFKPGEVVNVSIMRLGVDGIYAKINVPVTLGTSN